MTVNVRRANASLSQAAQILALFVAILLIAGVAGAAVAIGGPLTGAVLVSAIGMGVGLFIPIAWVFWLTIIASFVFVGPLQYFGGIDRVFWVPYLLGLFLTFRVVVEHAFTRSRLSTSHLRMARPMIPVALIIVFGITTIASSFFNLSPVFQVLLASKEYFFLWGAGLAIYWRLLPIDTFKKLLDYGHWFLLLQLPAIIYQRFVIAANRTGSSAWDAVVGLMGGNPNGGGASAAMAFCAIVIMAYNLAAWRTGLVRTPRLLLVLVVGMASILLAEVKLAIFLMPLAFCLVYAQDILRRPFIGLAVVSLSLGLGLLVLVTYQMQFSGARSAASQSVGEYVAQVIARNSGDQQINYATGEMGRVAALRLWWDQHRNGNPMHVLIGHGIGASRIGVVAGEVAQHFRFDIGRSTLVILLWEGGVIATAALICLFMLAARRGKALARSAQTKEQAVMFKTAAIGLFLTILIFPYGPDYATVAQAQLLAILMLATCVSASPVVSRAVARMPHGASRRRPPTSEPAALA